MEEGTALNQVKPSLAQEQALPKAAQEIQLLRAAKALFNKFDQGDSKYYPDLSEAAPKITKLKDGLLDSYNQLHCSRVSPDGRYFANLSATTLMVFTTSNWEKIADGELNFDDENNRLFDDDCPPFFFFPDSKHIGVTGLRSFSVFSIPRERFVSQVKYETFRKLGKAYQDGELVTDPSQAQKIAVSDKYFKFYNFFNVEGYSDAPRGCTRILHRPTALAMGTSRAIFLVNLVDWDYETPLYSRGYWMCPKIYDAYNKVQGFAAFDNLGLFCKDDGKMAILRFKESFFGHLNLIFEGAQLDASDTPAEKPQTDEEDDMDEERPRKKQPPPPSILEDEDIEMEVNALLDLCKSEIKFDSAEISPGAQEYLVLVNRNKLVGVNLYDPTIRNVYEFPGIVEDLGEPRSLVAGKFLMMIKDEQSYVFYKRECDYHLLVKIDQSRSYPGPFYLRPTNHLVIFKSGVPFGFSLELLADLTINDLTSDLVRKEAIRYGQKLNIYHEYLCLPEHQITFCRMKSTDVLLVSFREEAFERVPLNEERLYGWTLNKAKSHLFLNCQQRLFSYDLRNGQVIDLTPKIAERLSINLVIEDTAIVNIWKEGEQDTQVAPEQDATIGCFVVNLNDFTKVKKTIFKDAYEPDVYGEFVAQRICTENDQVCYKIFDFQENLIMEIPLAPGEKLWLEYSQDVNGLLVWTCQILRIFRKNQAVKSFKLDFSKFDDGIRLDISPDLEHVVAFCESSGVVKIYDSDNMEVRFSSQCHESEKRDYGKRQYFYFDKNRKYVFFLDGDEHQNILVYSLEHYILFASMLIPSGFKCNKFWLTNDETQIVALGVQVAETGSSSLPICESYSLISLEIPFSVSPKCEWGATRTCLLNIQEHQFNLKEKQLAYNRLLNVWKSLPEAIRNQNSALPWIIYAANSTKLLQSFLDIIIGTFDLAVLHKLLELFFSGDFEVEMAQCVVDNFKKTFDNRKIPFSLQMLAKSYFQPGRVLCLSANSLTRELTTWLLVNKTALSIKVQLVSDDFAMTAIQPSPFPTEDDSAVRPLLESNPDSLENFRVYETRFKLDLSNGSEFSCSLFELIAALPDEQLKTTFRPLIYYKWAVVFWFALAYFGIVLINNILAYIYLGYLHEVRTLGILNIVSCGLLILFEFKTVVSNAKVYRSSLWNFYDLAIYIFNIVAVIYNFSSSEEDRVTRASNIWLRFLPVTLLGIRSVTWLRVFSATRYMVTMVMEVFSEIAAFLVILTSILLVYAYAWRLAGGLRLGFDGPQTNFYASVLNSVNLIFGNSPDPLGEDGNSFDLLMFIVYVIGNVTLALVLLNFLIALISGTYDRVSSDKELYDAKELLPLIRDFDLFLKRSRIGRLPNRIQEGPGLPTKAFFALLVKEGSASLETQQLQSVIEASLQRLTSSLTSEISRIEASRENELKLLKAEFKRDINNLEKRSASMDQKLTKMSEDHSQMMTLLSRIAEKSLK